VDKEISGCIKFDELVEIVAGFDKLIVSEFDGKFVVVEEFGKDVVSEVNWVSF